MIQHNQNGEVLSNGDVPSGLLYADVFRGAWRRKGRVLLGLLLGLVAGAFCWEHWTPTYESQMQLLVVKRKVPESRVAGVSPQFPEFDDYLSAQKALLSSPLIVGRAVQRNQLARLESLESEEDPTRAIIEELRVVQESDIQSRHALLTLTYRCTVQEECKVVLEAIVDSYQAYLEDTQTGAVAEIQKIFNQWKDDVQESIAETQESYQGLRETTPAEEWTGKDGVNLSEQRLAQLEAERLAQNVRRTELQQRLAALREVKEKGASHAELAQIILHWSEIWRTPVAQESRDNQRIDANLRAELLSLKLREQSLPPSYGPAHPQVRALRDQLAMTEQMLLRQEEKEQTDATAVSRTITEVREADPVKAYFMALEKDLQVATELERSLSDLAGQEQQRARKINDLNEDMEALRGKIAGAEQLEQQIAQQVQSFGAIHDSDVYHAQVISPAAVGLLVAPLPWLVFPIATFLGVLVGGCLAYSAEVRDQSFRTPAEVRERLRVPVIGHTDYCRVPRRKRRQTVGSPAALSSVLGTFFVPDSTESEAYRRVRSMLSFNGNGRPKSVVQITSPHRGDGASTVAANLAVSIAQAGRRVVVVDADLRRPSLHEVFGVSREVGMMSVLTGLADLPEAVQSTNVDNLSVLPCETATSDSGELLGSDNFKRLLERLRSQFDFVLIDTPPVLGPSDACTVAHHVDVVVLTLQNTKNARPAAEQAVQTLTDQQAPLIGVVVNSPAPRGNRNHGYAVRHQEYAFASRDL